MSLSFPPALNLRQKRYLLAGAPAFALDAGLLLALAALGWSPLLARALSVFCGTAAAYLLHRRYTFTSQLTATTADGQPVPFAALQIMAGVLNYGVFARVLYSLPHPVGADGLGLALLAGALAGTCFNYLLLQRLLPAEETTGQTWAAERHTGPAGAYKRNMLWLLIACIAAQTAREHYQAVMQYPRLPYPLGPPDPDVWLYLTQVRQWLDSLSSGAGNWWAAFFDHTVRHTNAPLGGIATPWTRPMVLLLSLAYFLTPHGLPEDLRLMLGATWIGPALGFAAVVLLARAVRFQLNSLHAAGFAGILMVANPDIYNWYSPGNADHHGFLSTLWCGVLAFLMCDSLSALGALALGGTLGVMIWTSPEALVLAGGVLALLGAEGLLRPERAAAVSRTLVLTAAGTALVDTLALFVEMPPGQILAREAYDTLSIVYVTLLWLTVAAAAALAFAYRRPRSFGARFLWAGAAGAFVLGAMAVLYPKFFSGPFVDATEFYMGTLPQIGEAKPLLTVGADDVIRELMEPALALLLIGFALFHRKKSRSYVRPERRRRLLILLLLLVLTTGLTFSRVRWGYYLHPVAVVAVGMTIASVSLLLRTGAGRRLASQIPHLLPRQARPYLALWLVYIVMNVAIHQFQVANPPNEEGPNCLSQVRYIIQSQQLQPLLGAKELILFASSDAGGDVQFFTPYRIIASNFHREGVGLNELFDMGNATSAAAARPLLNKRQVSALLYCPGDYKPDSWLRSAAQAKKRPAWLTPVTGLRLFYPPDGTPPAPDTMPLLFRVK